MPSASPFLDQLLTRWIAQRSELERAARERVDEVRAAQLALEDVWSETRRRFEVDIREIEDSNTKTAASWLERLRRLEEWRKTIGGTGSELTGAESTVRSLRWFDRAESMADPLAERLRKAAERLRERQEALRQSLEIWDAALSSKEADLRAFLEREQQHPGPLLVSRGRKQPELDFVEGGALTEVQLSGTIYELRRRLNHHLGRLYRGGQALEQRAQSHPALFEWRKNQLMQRLQSVQREFFALREAILGDALYFEACRKRMRWITDVVKRMKCVEDVYRAPDPFWKRAWAQLTKTP